MRGSFAGSRPFTCYLQHCNNTDTHPWSKGHGWPMFQSQLWWYGQVDVILVYLYSTVKNAILPIQKQNLGLLFLLYNVSYKALLINFPIFHNQTIWLFFCFVLFAFISWNYTWMLQFFKNTLYNKNAWKDWRGFANPILSASIGIFSTYIS